MLSMKQGGWVKKPLKMLNPPTAVCWPTYGSIFMCQLWTRIILRVYMKLVLYLGKQDWEPSLKHFLATYSKYMSIKREHYHMKVCWLCFNWVWIQAITLLVSVLGFLSSRQSISWMKIHKINQNSKHLTMNMKWATDSSQERVNCILKG